ncbi:hypothetical protein E5H25_18025 [Acinetobacter baumannii]|uniref:hypothetical protein n=1 Tax=Acinetobacter baumannii TaxID=470 RepID=UPI0010A4D214|nr:hypothetical protein [Acinetobacter baumannii]MDO7242789.1 hypothetical protein [Acinetobacter baumannii]THD86653.1 hypothetical protein E5H25_18025 [Acinetobacter baumannii]HAV4576066.1 hypothetical protein [Acinetobacter baumannii]HDQ4387981.1 hypothetical protein [Acinetobacter baumannii]
MTDITKFYPINEDGSLTINFFDVHYNKVDRIDGLIKAEFSHFDCDQRAIEEGAVISVPKVFFIDHTKKLILNEQFEPIAKTTMVDRK